MSTLASSVVIALPSVSCFPDNDWRVVPQRRRVADLHHEASCNVPQLIVPDYGEATCWAAQGTVLH